MYAFYHLFIRLQDMLQVFIQTEAEAYHAEVEEDACRQEHSRCYIQPLLLKGSRMRMRGYNRIVVQQHDYVLIA